jgi:hypothetical protein
MMTEESCALQHKKEAMSLTPSCFKVTEEKSMRVPHTETIEVGVMELVTI